MSEQAINGLNIPIIQNNKQVSFKQNTTPSMQGITIPAQANDTFQHSTSMQGVDQAAVKQAADNSYLANRAKASADSNPLAVAGITTGLWYGIAQGMDKVNAKCEGKWEESILGKLGKAGDKISNTWLGKKIDRGLRRIDIQLERWSRKSKFLYSLRNHSTKPENKFAKVPGAGIHGFLSADAEQIVDEFLAPMAGKPKTILGFPTGKMKNLFQKLENYGIPQAEIDALFDSVKGKTAIEQAIELQAKELEILGANPKTIEKFRAGKHSIQKMQSYARKLKLNALGLTEKQFKALSGKFLDNPDEVVKIFERMANNPKTANWKVSIWRSHGGKLTKVKNHLFGRTVSFSEYRNKYYATLGKGTKSKLGRLFNKAFGWIVEGGTNRFAGGKLAVLMQAAIFGDMIYQSAIAPKGEKFKTLMERGVNDFSYFIALTLGIMGMHKIGGFKYAGLDNKGKAAYRKALEKFNQKADAGLFKSKKAYNAAEKALNAKLGAKNIKNPITKLFHKIGKFLNIGNERVHAYKSTSKWNLNWLRKLANGNIIGIPMRIIIPMMVVTPFIAKAATTLCHKIFGRPTRSVLDEEQEEQPDQAQQPNAQNPTQQPAVAPTQNPSMGSNPQPKDPQTYADSNLIKQTINGTKKPVRTYIPSPNCEIRNMAPTRSYIPSSQGMVQQSPDLTAAERAMAQADMAEKHINETLASLNQPL